MKKLTIFRNALKKNNKTFSILLLLVFIFSASISAYSFLQPTTTTNQVNENTSRVETEYDYKATVKPNILHPNGGTVEVGDTIFKEVTTAIPIDLKSIIESDQAVTVEGTHEVKAVVIAGDLWEREFPLEKEQPFKQEGTKLSLIDNTYTVDLNQIKSFITQVEEDVGIQPDQYTLEVVPNIQGTLTYDGVESDIQVQDKLTFQYSYDDLKLASDKVYTDSVPYTTSETITNTFQLFGLNLPLGIVRTVSTITSLLLLAAILYVYKNRLTHHRSSTSSIAEKIHKKYGSRIIPVAQNIDSKQEYTFTFDSIKSIIKVADEKELPIFCYMDQHDGGAVYFIVDGDYFYRYETSKSGSITSINTSAGSDKAYAKG